MSIPLSQDGRCPIPLPECVERCIGGAEVVRSFDNELQRLTGEIGRMGDIAVAQLDAAIDVMQRRDARYGIETTLVNGTWATDIVFSAGNQSNDSPALAVVDFAM